MENHQRRVWFSAARPRLGMGIIAFVALACVVVIACIGISSDNGVDRFIVHGDEHHARFQAFRRDFGSNEVLLVGLRLDAPPTPELFVTLGELRGQIRGADVLACEKIGRSKPILSHVLGVDTHPGTRNLIESGAENELMSLPGVSGVLYSRSGKDRIAILLGSISESLSSPEAAVFIDEVNDAISMEDAFVFGSPAITTALDRANKQQALTLFPLLALVTALVVWSLTGRWQATLWIGVTTAVSILVGLTIMTLFGRPVNMITTAVPAVLMVLTSATSLHLFRSFAAGTYNGISNTQAAAAAAREQFRPCLLATITTGVGFLSLLTSDVAPTRDLGLFACLGIIAGFCISMTLLPAIFSSGLVPSESGRGLPRGNPPTWLMSHPRLVLMVTILVGVFGSFGLGRLEVESSAIRFLPNSHPVVQTYDELQAKGIGITPVEVCLRSKELEPLLSPATLNLLRVTRQDVLELPYVKGASAITDLIDTLVFPGVTDEASAALLLSQLVEKGEESETQLLREAARSLMAYGPEGWALRLRLATTASSVREFNEVIGHVEKVVEKLKAETDADVVEITGLAPVLVAMETYLIESQVRSLCWAFAMVAIVMLIGLRSWRLALLGALPNVMPILLIYGVMGWIGLSLDVATVMVGAVALGIAVDDTVHVLMAWKNTEGRREATQAALQKVWWPVLTTSMAAAAGFLVLSVSAFIPMRKFGFITSAVMVLAVVADLLVLPSLLLLFGARRRAKESS